MQRHLTDLAPRLDVTAQLGQAAELDVVIWDAGGWDLVEALGPQRHAGTPLGIGGDGVESRSKQPDDVQRHECEVAQVHLDGDKRRLSLFVHPALPQQITVASLSIDVTRRPLVPSIR